MLPGMRVRAWLQDVCVGLRCGGGKGRGVDLVALPACCAASAGAVALEVVAGRGSPFLVHL